MKVGDLVKVHSRKLPMEGGRAIPMGTGVIIDVVEMEDGFEEFEVLLEDGEMGWFSDMSLKVISSTR